MADINLQELGFELPKGPTTDDLASTKTSSSYSDSEYYNSLNTDQKRSFDEMEDDLKKRFAENGWMPPTKSSYTKIDPKVSPIPGTGQLARDVTDEVKEVATADANTYDSFYERPENAGPAGAGLLTEGVAAISDAVDYVTGDDEENSFQVASAEADKAREAFLKSAESIYTDEGISVEENGERVIYDYYTNPETGELEERRVLMPAPDQIGALERITTNAYRGVVGQIGGLTTEGALLEESEFEKNYPQYDQGSGEGFLTDIIEFGVPAAGALKLSKGARAAAAATRYVPSALRSSKIAAGTAYLADLGVVGLTDAAMSREGDVGLLIKPETIQEFFDMSDDDANDLAMFFDSMAFGGGLDVLASVAGSVGKPFGKKIEGARSFTSKSFLRDKAQQGTLLSVLETLDPEILKGSNLAKKRRLAKLSEVLSDNAFLNIAIGGTKGSIPNDTATALLQGSKEYIANAHTHIRNQRGMSATEYKEYVNEQAAIMSLKMIEISRYRAADPSVLQANAKATQGIGDLMQSAGDAMIPEGMNPEVAIQQAVDSFVALRNKNVGAAQAGVETAEAGVKEVGDRASQIQFEVPELQELANSRPEDTFFRSAEYVEKLRNAMVDDTGKSLFNIYEQTWKQVNDAYAAIPNAPVDLQSFKNELDAIFSDGVLDNSGSTARSILKDIDDLFKPKKTGEIEDPLAIVGENNTRSLYEEASDRLNTLSEDVGFQDLLQFKQRLEKKIGSMPYGDPVRVRLEQLSRHITDSDSGQLAFVAKSDGEAAALAQNAIDTFISAKSRFENSPPMERFSELARKPATVGRNTARPDDGPMRGMPELQAYTSNIQGMPSEIIADETGGYLKNLVLAAGDQSSAVVAPIQEFVEAKAVDDLIRAMSTGNQMKVEEIFSSVNPYRSQLETLGSPLLEKLESAAARFRQLETELGSAELAADAALKEAQDNLASAQDTVLEKFISKYDSGNLIGNPKDALKSFVMDKDSVNAIKQMQEQINTLPEGQRQIAEAVLKRASIDSVVKDVFGATPISIEAFNTKMGRLKSILDENGNNIIGGLQQVLKDDPVAMEGVRLALGGLMTRNIPPRLKINQAGSDTFMNQEMADNISDSVRTGILAIFGFMNPTSTMTRQLAQSRIKNLEGLAKEVGEETLTMIAANPLGFSQLVKDLQKATTSEARKQLSSAFVTTTGKGIGYQVRVDEEADVYQQGVASQMSDILSAGEQKYNDVVGR